MSMPGIFKPKKAEVLKHWIAFVDGFQLPPSEFYERVEKELKAKEVPDLKIDRPEFAETGFLSAKRIYLRMNRERLVFDVCAAPFGKSFFFSCRFSELPDGNIVPFYFAGLFLFLGTLAAWNAYGPIGGILGLVALLFWVGAFPRDTYYRQDTRLMYLEIVSGLVKQLAEEAVASKGFKLVRQYDQAPVLGDLYKPVTPPIPQPK